VGRLAQTEHAPRALRYMAVAALYGMEDPGEEGRFLLRAAWADEAAGRGEPARALRRRAGVLLEDALYQGRALVPERGASSLKLAEIFRVAGDTARALQHARRGVATGGPPRTSALSRDVFSLLLVTAQRAIDANLAPLTRSEARAVWNALPADERKAMLRRLETACPEPEPVRLQPRRQFHAPELYRSTYDEMRAADAVFAQDFLTPELLVELIPVSLGLWAGVAAHPELLVHLLLAMDHRDPRVRDGALSTLERKTASDWKIFAAVKLDEHLDAVRGLAHRLEDRDWKIVCGVATVLRHVVALAPSWAAIVRPVAERLIPAWSSDASAQGALERLVATLPSG
jgi:hypothetical protein